MRMVSSATGIGKVAALSKCRHVGSRNGSAGWLAIRGNHGW